MYDYKNEIKVATTPNGDVVITMSKAVHTKLRNDVFDAHRYQRGKSIAYTAKDTLELWIALAGEDYKEGE